MTPKEYARATRGLRAAQARVVGILRGGFFDPSEGLFYYTVNGHHSVDVPTLTEFAFVPKRKRLKRDKQK